MNIKKNGKVSGKVLKQEKLGKSEELKGSLSKYGDKGRDCCKMSSPSDPLCQVAQEFGLCHIVFKIVGNI